MISNNDLLSIGTLLCNGKYRIEKHLASGGFGKTYLATDTSFDEIVAIKELYIKGLCGRDAVTGDVAVTLIDNKQPFMAQQEKFRKEARRLRKLDNKHIVKVRDLFDENGTSYYVMDFIDGESLSERIKRIGRLSESDIMALLPQILDALDAVHKEQIWHLDLKPANIMVDSNGCVKLIDFGASKQLRSSDGTMLSTSSTLAYTPGFASSELMEQNLEKFGPWTDLYSLGATIYYALTLNQPPSPSDINENPTEALKLPSNIGEKMAELVAWLMKPNRMERPKNAKEVSLSLRDMCTNINIGDNVNSCEDTIIAKNDDEGNISKEEKPKNKLLSVIDKIFVVLLGAYSMVLIALLPGLYSIKLYDKVADLSPTYISKIDYSDPYLDLIVVIVGTIEFIIFAVFYYWHNERKDQFYQFNKAYKAYCEKRYKKAVKWFRKAAEQGYAAAQFNLGYCYDEGQGVEQNYEEAVKWYRLAAEQGNAAAQCSLGYRYDEGQAVEQNYEEAVKWYRKAVEQEKQKNELLSVIDNSFRVFFGVNIVLLFVYFQDTYSVIPYKKVVDLLHTYISKNDYIDSDLISIIVGTIGIIVFSAFYYWHNKRKDQFYQFNKAYKAYCEKRYNKAVKWCLKAAEQGNAVAQCNLGVSYCNGQGVEQNYEEAVLWYRKAAEQGHARAQLLLGYCYEYGQGVEQNYQEAVKWYRKSAEQGNADAQCNLGICYYKGQGVERDLDKAKEMFKKVLETETEGENYEIAMDSLKEIESLQK